MKRHWMSKDHLPYREGYKYVTNDPICIFLPELAGHSFKLRDVEDHCFAEMDNLGYLTVHAEYSWDGSSGPTHDDKTNIRGSLFHDVLYQALRMGKLPPDVRPIADRILREVCVQDGGWRLRYHIWERMVNWFAKAAARRQKPDVLYAP